jgi:hypothetical protein
MNSREKYRMASTPYSWARPLSATTPEMIPIDTSSLSTGLYETTSESASRLELSNRLHALEEKMASLVELITNKPIVYTTQILDLDDSRLQLRCPIPIVVETYPDEVVATVPEFNLYASGISATIALAKLKLEISSTYIHFMEFGPGKLGSLLCGNLAAMNQAIKMHND